MGLYRAQMNTPILKFGKTALLSDTDPLVEAWLASGAFIRLDDISSAPMVREVEPEAEAEPEVEPEVEAEVEAKPEPKKPGRPKGSTNRPKVDDNSGLNPTFGIQFDDDEDA